MEHGPFLICFPEYFFFIRENKVKMTQNCPPSTFGTRSVFNLFSRINFFIQENKLKLIQILPPRLLELGPFYTNESSFNTSRPLQTIIGAGITLAETLR